MSLVVEDGTGVSGANSYISLADARLLLADRGLTLPVSDSSAEQLLIKAMDWLEGKRDRFQGYKTSAAQALQWPRAGVTLDGYPLDDDVIPQVLQLAQCLLAVEAVSGSLYANTSGQRILSERVDVLETRYSNSSSVKAQPHFGAVESLLAPLYKYGNGLPVFRV